MKTFKEWIKDKESAQFRVVYRNDSGNIEVVSRISDNYHFFRLQTMTISIGVQSVAVIKILRFSSNLKHVHIVIIQDKEKGDRCTRIVPIDYIDIHPNEEVEGSDQFYMSLHKFNRIVNTKFADTK